MIITITAWGTTVVILLVRGAFIISGARSTLRERFCGHLDGLVLPVEDQQIVFNFVGFRLLDVIFRVIFRVILDVILDVIFNVSYNIFHSLCVLSLQFFFGVFCGDSVISSFFVFMKHTLRRSLPVFVLTGYRYLPSRFVNIQVLAMPAW